MSSRTAGDESETKVLRFTSDVPVEVQRAKYQATAKYDIKLVRKRLEIEEWMHFELKNLYNCEVSWRNLVVKILARTFMAFVGLLVLLKCYTLS